MVNEVEPRRDRTTRTLADERSRVARDRDDIAYARNIRAVERALTADLRDDGADLLLAATAVTGVEVPAAAVSCPGEGLRERLRVETAEWHDKVEAVADVPGSVRSRDSYFDFLGRLYVVHACFESVLSARMFEPGWRGVGLNIAAHGRAHLLADDLSGMGYPGVTCSVRLAPPVTFGQALGCLYVLEGSALGGPTVARLVRAVIGEVPTAFLTGRGRQGVKLWRAVCEALRAFDAQSGDCDEVVAGACQTFAVFAEHLSPLASAP
jgi:heme oxygenase